jgi:hypothetical protein
MDRRWRVPRYGASIGVALVGVICGATLPGTVGGTLATVLIGIGLVGVLSLIFYEVGLSEDRDRARPRRRVEPPPPPAHDSSERADEGGHAGRDQRLARPRSIDRRRGERRRLR